MKIEAFDDDIIAKIDNRIFVEADHLLERLNDLNRPLTIKDVRKVILEMKKSLQVHKENPYI